MRKRLWVLLLCFVRHSWKEQVGWMQTWQDRKNAALTHYKQKDHNYDLEEDGVYTLGEKGAFDVVKALDSKERACWKVEITYQTFTYSSETRLDVFPPLLVRPAAISSREEMPGKTNELSEKQEISPKGLERTQNPRAEREPEESCGNSNVLLGAVFWAALGGTRTMERIKDLHCSLEKERIPTSGDLISSVITPKTFPKLASAHKVRQWHLLLLHSYWYSLVPRTLFTALSDSHCTETGSNTYLCPNHTFYQLQNLSRWQTVIYYQ